MLWKWAGSSSNLRRDPDARLSLGKYESCFLWQSIRNNWIVEWERPGVSESDLMHTNFLQLSHASPLFRTNSNSNFLNLLVKLES